MSDSNSSGIEDFTEMPFGKLRPNIAARTAWWLATAKALPRSARKWFRKRLARKFPGPFDVVADGVRLRAWPTENRCDRVAIGRGLLPEASERRLIEPYLKPNMRFVDIGANVGVYSLFVSHRTAGTAKVLSLEPHPRTFAKLVCNRAMNGFTNIEVVNFAAGPEEGEAALFSDGGGNIGGASMLSEASGDNRSVAIKTKPLPDILAERGFDQIDLLKADVEGFEDRALLPLFATPELESVWPKTILIETVHRRLWQTDIVELLQKQQYSVASETAENLLLCR